MKVGRLLPRERVSHLPPQPLWVGGGHWISALAVLPSLQALKREQLPSEIGLGLWGAGGKERPRLVGERGKGKECLD